MPSRKCLILAAKHPKNYRKMRVYAIHMGGCECQLTHWEEWDVIVSSWWSLFGGGGSEPGSGSESESESDSEVGRPVCGRQMPSTTWWIKSNSGEEEGMSIMSVNYAWLGGKT